MVITLIDDPRYNQAIHLERKLQLYLGTKKRDWLSQYRIWLDENGITAEVDGWPSTEAHHDHNIQLFVRQQRR